MKTTPPVAPAPSGKCKVCNRAGRVGPDKRCEDCWATAAKYWLWKSNSVRTFRKDVRSSGSGKE